MTEEARHLLGEEGYDPSFGARPLKRVIQQQVENPLAGKILAGEFADGDTIKIDIDKARHAFTFGAIHAKPAEEPAHQEPVGVGGRR